MTDIATTQAAAIVAQAIARLTAATTGGTGGSVSTAGLVKADGTVPLAAPWAAGNFNITSKNSTAWINVAQQPPGGAGAVGSPWTGWDTAITWTAGTTYYAPAGFYS